MPSSPLNIRGVVASGIMGLSALFAPAVAGGSLKDSEAPAATERGVWYSGYDAVKGSQYVLDGVIVALNGDYSKDGWVIKAYGSRVDYDLNPGNGRGWQADAMIGYKVTRSKIDMSIYAGVDWQNYKLKPDDPTEDVRGTQFGFKVAADLETDREELPYYFALDGNYSTAFNSYWARGRAGLNRNRVTFGPEVIAMGNDGFDAQRVGGFAIFTLKLLPGRPPFDVTLSAGHQFESSSSNGGTSNRGSVGGGEGTYGAIVISTNF